jgi:hypothetical protein
MMSFNPGEHRIFRSSVSKHLLMEEREPVRTYLEKDHGALIEKGRIQGLKISPMGGR